MTIRKRYRSRCGRQEFGFSFERSGGHVDIRCTLHPSLNGRDASVSRTHLYSSGLICFVGGKEPRTLSEAEQRAAEWAEYLLSYIRTGTAQ